MLSCSLGEIMNESVGDKIKQLRLAAKLSQEDLAKALYFSNRTISNWEKNLREVSLGNLTKIAAYFHVPLTYFTDSKGSTIPNTKSVFQEVKSKRISIDQRDFYFLLTALIINILLIFIPFASRPEASMFKVLFWAAYLIFSIVRYNALDRTRLKVFLVPLEATVYYQSEYSLGQRKAYRTLNAIFYGVLIIFSTFFYAGTLTMINTYEYDVVLTTLIVLIYLITLVLAAISLIKVILLGPPKETIPFLKDRIDLGMLMPRAIVTLHYALIVFLVIIISAYGHEIFPLDFLLFNLFNGLFVFLLLRVFLINSSKFYDAYKLFSHHRLTDQREKLSE